MYNRRHPPVPTTTSVLPGAPVNIVLKADQPTGRTVQGVVRDVLTRGNHPRGIKVRLADGRVGRVQSMASAAASSSSSTPSSGATGGVAGGAAAATTAAVDGLVEGMQRARIEHDDDGDEQEGRHAHQSEEGFRSGRGGRRGGTRGGRGGGGGGGGRFQSRDEEDELPSQQIGLDAYVKEARPRRRGRGNQSAVLENDEEQNPDPPAPQDTVTCPVCCVFEGDEAAVSHHVASHFEESVS